MIWVLNVLSALEKEYWIFHFMGCRSSFKKLQKDFLEHLLIIFNRFMTFQIKKQLPLRKNQLYLIIFHKGLMHVQTLKPTKSTFYLNPQSFTVHNILILSNEYLVKLP